MISPIPDLASQTELDAPPSPELKWIRWCLVIFLFSFALDYKAPDLKFDSERTGGSIFQFAFLGLALATSGLAFLIGWRYLLVRPGTYLIGLWWSYLFFMVVVSFLSGNELGRILRLLVTPLLVGLGLITTHIASCAGMRPHEAVRWFLAAAVVDVIWSFFFGLVGYGISLSEVRVQILSPGMTFLFAWVGCALLLCRSFNWWILPLLTIPLIPAVLSVTRTMALPILAAAIGAFICLILGMAWRLYTPGHPFRKLVPITIVGVAAVGGLLVVTLAVPEISERWTERLFHRHGGGAMTEDVSSLMRKAEAKAMVDLLTEEPTSFLYGKGLGASYYWDESFYPELFQVYPEDRHQFADNIYTAGHSIWTYALFSSGLVGVGFVLITFIGVMFLSLKAAWVNSQTVMGRWAYDVHLLFLPFVTVGCLLSVSMTRNPFDERMTGILFGFVASLPQFFFNRACYLSHREQQANLTPQIILDEEEFPEEWDTGEPVLEHA